MEFTIINKTNHILILDNYQLLVVIHLLGLQIVKTRFYHTKRLDK